MPVLTRRASFWTSAAVAGVSLWASAAPTTNYPLYETDWHLAPWVPTAIFATYPVVLIPMLLIFGNLSDYVGRRRSMLYGLIALALGALVFGLAPDLTLVFVGRALMGVGVGLSLSPASAAIIEFSGPERASSSSQGRANSTTTASTAVGLAFATLVGGALVQYGPAPLYLDFWVLFVVTIAALVLVAFLPRHTPDEAAGRWRPRGLLIPRSFRTTFFAGVLAVTAAYAIGAIFIGLGAQLVKVLIHSDNALVGGAVISVSAITIGIVAVLARPIRPLVAVTIGPALVALGMISLVFAGLGSSLALFITSAVVGGAGYSLLFAGGLGLIIASTPSHHRGAALSTGYAVGYAAQAATALVLGALATSSGYQSAIDVGLPIVVLLALAALVLALVGRRASARIEPDRGPAVQPEPEPEPEVTVR